MRIILAITLIAATSAYALDPPTMDEGILDTGTATLTPTTATAGEYGTWNIIYTIGPEGIAANGGLRVQMPDVFHAGPRNSAIALQHIDSTFPNYITATSSNTNANITAEVEHFQKEGLVKSRKPALDGRSERYVFVVRVSTDSALAQGDTLTLTYGDTSGGSPGLRAGDRIADNAPVLLAIDSQGDSTFQRIASSPSITVQPGAPYELQLHAPSQATQGKPYEVLISVVDKESNPTTLPIECDFTLSTGKADFEKRVAIPAGQGYTRFTVTPSVDGIVRLSGKCLAYNLDAHSNPTRIAKDVTPTYWGDIHSHTQFSWDGVGTGAFHYARNIAGLDFYTRTDHSIQPDAKGTVGLRAENYKEYGIDTDVHNDPGRFVTLHAYECSFGRPYGHHIVYFRGAQGVLANPQTTTLEKLWEIFGNGDALTIPHHTGKFPNGVDFRIHDERFRRNFEIYSGHGLSETFDPHHPLAFEHSRFTSPAKSLNAPSHAQDAWRWGLQLSTVSGSDDHRAQPGKPQYGLTAIRTDALTRDGVFQALYDRQTYATTGAKILLDFQRDGTSLTINAHGTDTIAWVELLRYQPDDDAFQVIKRWDPLTLDFNQTFNDEAHTPGTIYYTRLQQTNQIRNRAVMAWSSPIWIE